MVMRRVNVEAILDLRREVLRPDHTRDGVRFDGDDHPQTYHFAAFDNERIIACVTLMPSTFDARRAWQLRGMAVAPSWRGAGVGGQLLRHITEHLPAPRTVWCNARLPAVGFYQRHGWAVVSEPFEIAGVGPHRRMVLERQRDGLHGADDGA